MSKHPLSIRIDNQLVQAIDGVRGGVNRTAWIEVACRRALGQVAESMVESGATVQQAAKAIDDTLVPTTRPKTLEEARASFKAFTGR
jgi:hypothetical protein